jgi:CubicO group peptidase (beta-lactamase class C family)
MGARKRSLLATGASSVARNTKPLPAVTPESQGFDPVRLAKLDAALAQAVANGQVGGMLTLLARNGKIVSFKAYGDAAPGRPMDRDTIFSIFSMTKPVTAVAMMMLFEEGKWALDDPVTRFIPEFADLKVATGTDGDGQPILEPARRPPTMRELMSHTAGFAYGLGDDPANAIYRQQNPMGAENLQRMVERLAEVPLLFQPGSGWRYSVAVDVQGHIIEKLSGLSLGAFFRTRIFEPLGMVDTAFHVPPEKYDRLASLYSHDESGKLVPGGTMMGRQLSDYRAPPALESGGAGLLSTIDDYARFAEMLANRGALGRLRLLAPVTVDLMAANVVPDDVIAQGNPYPKFSKGIGWGMGVATINDPPIAGRIEGRNTISWEGAAGTWFWSDPTNHVLFVGMIQNFEYAGPKGYDGSGLVRPLVYQALVAP